MSIGLQASIVGYMVTSFFAAVAYNWFIYYLIAYAVAFVVAYRADMRDHTTHPMRWVDLRTASLPK